MALANEVRATVRAQDPQLAVFGVEPLDETISRSVSERRFAMLLVTAFAGVALFLAAIGVYGVLSYDVAARRRELGIRLALGSARRAIVQLVVGHALMLTGIALVIGVLAALSLSTLLSAMLFGVAAQIRSRLRRWPAFSGWWRWRRRRFPRGAPRAPRRRSCCGAISAGPAEAGHYVRFGHHVRLRCCGKLAPFRQPGSTWSPVTR